jgi:hypothetical protein
MTLLQNSDVLLVVTVCKRYKRPIARFIFKLGVIQRAYDQLHET